MNETNSDQPTPAHAPAQATPAAAARNELRIGVRTRNGGYEIVTLGELERRRESRQALANAPTPQAPEPPRRPSPESAGGDEPKAKKKRVPRADSWSEIRRQLQTWDQPRLLGLIQDLCDAVPDVRTALAGRLSQAPSARSKSTRKPVSLDPLLKKVALAIRGRGQIPKVPNLAEAKRVAEQYARVSADADGSIRLNMEIILQLIGLDREFGGTEDREMNAAFAASDRIVKLIPDATNAVMLQDMIESGKEHLREKWLTGWVEDLLVSLVPMLEARLSELVQTETPRDSFE